MLGYVLFPHLIVGLILRPNELMPQFRQERRADARLLLGISLFTMGLVKKLVFADQISAAVGPSMPTRRSHGLALPSSPSGFGADLCDFSGYTDMAIGLATCSAFASHQLPAYGAASLTQFWRGTSRCPSGFVMSLHTAGKPAGQVTSHQLVTMVLGGLCMRQLDLRDLGCTAWRGRPVTFAVLRMRLPLAGLLTFHFVTLAWVFFRAPDLPRRSGYGAVHRRLRGCSGTLGNGVPILLTAVFLATHAFDRHARLRWFACTATRSCNGV
jgi:hypothetical protein